MNYERLTVESMTMLNIMRELKSKYKKSSKVHSKGSNDKEMKRTIILDLGVIHTIRDIFLTFQPPSPPCVGCYF